MKKKWLVLLLITVTLIPLYSVVRRVSLDQSQTYTSIQTAINEANQNDTVLVYPGHYLENIDLSFKTDLYLYSLEAMTQDSSYISQTIIDGRLNDNSTILCFEQCNFITIRGFSITGGTGYRWWGVDNYYKSGGGIQINKYSNISLIHLNIYNNKANQGGGVSIKGPSSVVLKGVNIYENIGRWCAGGIQITAYPDQGLSNIIFDQNDRCSIYNNVSTRGVDIEFTYTQGETMSIYLKKFTVPFYDSYFANFFDDFNYQNPYTVFDVQEGFLTPIQADLYVSPNGDDNNIGLSVNSPLKTITLALQRIASNPANPHTIHLSEGIFQNIIKEENIPISIKDYVTLKGESPEQTKLYADNMINDLGVVFFGSNSHNLVLKNLSITGINTTGLYYWRCFNSLVENVIFEDCISDISIFVGGTKDSELKLRNVTMRNNLTNRGYFGILLNGRVIEIDSLKVLDSRRIEDVYDIWSAGGMVDIGIADSLIITNSVFMNNHLYSYEGYSNFRVFSNTQDFSPYVKVENCLFANNETIGGAYHIAFPEITNLDFINNTLVHNSGDYNSLLQLDLIHSNVINCLFAENEVENQIITIENCFVDNCLFENAENSAVTWSGQPLNWGTHNLVGVNPMLMGGDPTLMSYYQLKANETLGYSPAINAGTTSHTILPDYYQIPEYDIIGNQRIYGSGIDIGCFEAQNQNSIVEVTTPQIKKFSLTNYPNPFNPTTTISFDLPSDDKIEIEIFNIKGQLVKTLIKETKNAGHYQIVWEGKDNQGKAVGSGVYFTKMKTSKQNLVKKMLLMK